MKRKLREHLILGVGIWLACYSVGAQDAGSPTTMPPVPESRVMHESFWYSAYASRSWVVGYAPKSTSLFLNPREFPQSPEAPVVWRVLYKGTLEGFCKTPYNARPTGLPSGSQALGYHYGLLGVTAHLSNGYPDGKHVVEPIIVPHASSSRPGGILIVGAPTQLTFAPDCKSPGKVSTPRHEPPLEK